MQFRKIIETLDSDDEALLDTQTISIVETTNLPLIRLIEQDIALKGIKHAKDFVALNSEKLEVICFDVVINFMQNTIQSSQALIQSLAKGADDVKDVQDFIGSQRSLMQLVNNYRSSVFQKALATSQLRQQTEQREKFILNEFGKLFSQN